MAGQSAIWDDNELETEENFACWCRDGKIGEEHGGEICEDGVGILGGIRMMRETGGIFEDTHNNIGSKEREKGELGKSRDGEWVIREIDQCSKCIVCGVLAGLLAQLPHTHKHTHAPTGLCTGP